jgi:hypothetical protein
MNLIAGLPQSIRNESRCAVLLVGQFRIFVQVAIEVLLPVTGLVEAGEDGFGGRIGFCRLRSRYMGTLGCAIRST